MATIAIVLAILAAALIISSSLDEIRDAIKSLTEAVKSWEKRS